MNTMKFIIVGLVIGSVIAMSFVLLHTSFKTVTEKVLSQLYAWNMIPKPETFTELYFENYTSLPFEIAPNKNYSFAFIIHNLEYKPMLYSYLAYLKTGSQKILLQKGDSLLQQDQKKTLRIAVSTISALPKSEIVVDLVNKQQDISFWINNK